MATQDTSKLIHVGAAIQDVGDTVVGGTGGQATVAKATGGAGKLFAVGPDGIPGFTYGGVERAQSVGDNVATYGATNYTSFTVATGRTVHRISARCRDLRLVYTSLLAASAAAPDAPFSNDFEIKASIEINAVVYPVYFSGFRVQLMKPGVIIESDPVGVEVAAGTDIFVRTWCNRLASTSYTAANGEAGKLASDKTNWPNNTTVRGFQFSTTEGVTSSALTGIDPFTLDLTDSGSISASNNQAYGPSQIRATQLSGSPKSVALIGDGYIRGISDIFNNAGRGFGTRAAIAAGASYTTLSIQSATAAGWSNSLAFNRSLLAGYCSTALVCLGSQDLLGTTTVAQLQTSIATIYSRLSARVDRVVFCTLPPRATSTDNFTTLVNQTTVTTNSFNAKRIEFNNWLRTQSGYHWVECADPVESSRDSGIFKVPTGIITSGTATATSATSVTDSSKSWVADAYLGYSVIISNQAAPIWSNTATVLSVLDGFSPTPGATDPYVISALYTASGSTLTPIGHQAIAASISAATFF